MNREALLCGISQVSIDKSPPKWSILVDYLSYGMTLTLYNYVGPHTNVQTSAEIKRH